MNSNLILLAAAPVRPHIPKDKPLKERLLFAMRYVRSHQDLFFFVGKATDDLMFRTAIGAVILEGSEEDRMLIERSMQPLKILAAALSGIPVDFSRIDFADDLLPLMRMFKESEAETKKG